jgi:phosphopantothenoylcysteine synthetase/decarboxylase
LEHNTVRFVDNFSAGTRGAASAEYFLDNGYAVIFMHRQKSLEPFTRHFNGQRFMDMLEIYEKDDNTAINGKLRSFQSLMIHTKHLGAFCSQTGMCRCRRACITSL